jgi:FixJ family two-component response regulator
MDSEQTVFIVDDDEGVRDGLSLLLSTVGQHCVLYASATEFLDDLDENKHGCLVLDIRMPRMTGLELQKKLIDMGSKLPIIFITGHGDIPMAVEAMRRGAVDFIRKPFREHDLLDRINEALNLDDTNYKTQTDHERLDKKLKSLTERELEVFERVADGRMNKVIANDLGISERTVEVHRGQMMKKLGAKTLAQLVRFKIYSEMRAEV